MNSHPERHKYAADRRPPLWERIVAGISLLLVVGLLGYLLYQAIGGDDSPPNIHVKVTEIRASGEDFLVVFEARNDGGKTAAGVVITGRLTRWGIVTETAEATLDFIPAESSRRGGLFFQQDPRETDLKLMPSGYTLP